MNRIYMRLNILPTLLGLLASCLSCLSSYAQSVNPLVDASGVIKKYDNTFDGIGPEVYFVPAPQKENDIINDFKSIALFTDSIHRFALQEELINSFENTRNYSIVDNIILLDSISLQNWDKAVAYQIEADNTLLATGLLNAFAKEYILKKEYIKAETLLTRALNLIAYDRTFEDKAVLQANLASILIFNNNYTEAKLLEEELYLDAKKSKSLTNEANSHVKLALLEAYSQEYTNAENRIIRKAIPLFNRAKDYDNKINAWIKLGKIYTLNKKYIQAQWFLIQAQELAKLKNIAKYDAQIEFMLGYAKFYQNNLHMSEKELTQALKLAQENGNKYIEIAATQMLGEIALKQNKIDDAETFLNSYWKLRKAYF